MSNKSQCQIWSDEWAQERANSQMTLGKLISRLEELPLTLRVEGLGLLSSYRAYNRDLAFIPDKKQETVESLTDRCKKALGKTYTSYRGNEDYIMNEHTPLWLAFEGRCGTRLINISDEGDLELCDEQD